MSTLTATKDFVVSRTFDAPREQVWKAWTEADRLAQWWGPKGCGLRIVSLDLRPGGIFHYAMQYTAGAPEVFGRFVYREIVAQERLVYVGGFADAEAAAARVPFLDTFPLETLSTVTFAEQNGRTVLTLHCVPIDPTDEEQRAFESMFACMNQGYGGTMDKLAAYLATSR